MRPQLIMPLMIAGAIAFASGCKSDDERSSSSDGGKSSSTTKSSSTAGNGTLSGDVKFKYGAPPSSAANAAISLESHPEVSGKTDANGHYELLNVPPGTHTVYVLSAGASLSAAKVAPLALGGSTSYGLKIDKVVVSAGNTTDLGARELKETGAISGTVDFYSNPNNLDVTGTDVYIPGTGFIAKTDANGHFYLKNIPVGTYTLRVEHTGFAAFKFENVIVNEGQETVLGDVSLSLSLGPEGAISVTPSSTVTIGGAAKKLSTSRTVALTLDYDSEAALMKISDESSFLNKSWIPVAASSSWTFASDGAKTLYVKFSDLNGLESSPYYDAIIVDTEAPTLTSISLLNGWVQTASQNIFLDSAASDTGSGVSEIMISNVNATLPGGTWQTYSSRVNWALTAGAGAKTVWAKVRDYAGRESAVASDSINLGDATVIYNGSYPGKMALYAAQSPYELQDSITFDNDLEIEQGTTVQFTANQFLTVKGVLTAVGKVASPITFRLKNLIAGNCPTLPTLALHQGLPGVSEKNMLDQVILRQIGTVNLNGGTVQNSTFDNSGCTDAAGILNKTGMDNLTINAVNFVNVGTALTVGAGNGNTQFTNNTGSVVTAMLQQTAPATGTLVSGNNFTFAASAPPPVGFDISNGTLTTSNNTLSGASLVVVRAGAGTNFAVSGLTVPQCATIVRVFSGGGGSAAVQVSNSTFSSCTTGVTGETMTGTATFDHNNITLVPTSAAATSPATLVLGVSGGPLSATFTNNNIYCTKRSGTNDGFCDFFYTSENGSNHSLTMNSNNLDCPSNGDTTKGCRGFAASTNGGARTATITMNLNGNFWMNPGTSKVHGNGLSLSTNNQTSAAAILAGAPAIYNLADGGGSLTYTWSDGPFSSATSSITGAGP